MDLTGKEGKCLILGNRRFLIRQTGENTLFVSLFDQLEDNYLVFFSPDGNYNLYQLIENSYKWKFQDCQGEIKEEIELTSSDYINAIILSKLSDEDLDKICFVNPNLCENEELWRLKIVNKFGKKYLTFDPPNLKEYYRDLKKLISLSYEPNYIIPEINNLAIEGKLHLLKAAEEMDYLPDPAIIGNVIRANQEEIKNWLLQKIPFDSVDADTAIILGDMEALEFYLQNNIYPNIDTLKERYSQRLKKAKFLLEKYGIKL